MLNIYKSIIVLYLIKFTVIVNGQNENENENFINLNLPEIHNKTKFYYFGYGSNMLERRIHLQNPTAERVGVALLQNYSLDFNNFSNRWKGAAATVVPQLNGIVYGALWEMDMTNLDDIDRQEGVHLNIYYPFNVPVILLPNNTEIIAHIYIMVDQPEMPLSTYHKDNVPFNRQPSKTYLKCLVKGAQESNINLNYVNWLKGIKHNNRIAIQKEHILELEDVDLFE